MSIFTFCLPTKIIHGEGSLTRLGPEMKALGAKHCLLVTDPGIVAAGLVAEVVAELDRSALKSTVFSGVKNMATLGAAEEGRQAARAGGCDSVVAVGGGSVLAVGKGIAALTANQVGFRELVGVSPLPKRPLPIIAIPTTAGSGSEVSQFIPLVDEERGSKDTVGGPDCFPPVAILEPRFLLSVPYRQALYSGIDALTHAIEAYWTTLATPITDALALAAMSILVKDLRQTAATGSVAARENCLVASSMANMACGNAKLGLVHHLNRFINGMFPQIPYGLGIGVLLPYVMEFNLPAAVDRFAQMALAMGEVEAGRSRRELADRAVYAVKRLIVDLDFPRSFSPEQLDRSKIPELARLAVGGGTYAPNPNLRRATCEDCMVIYEQALQGWDF